ncbi:ATP-dependent metallopeptidase FtsH/Yme1/Tma family protein, partial [Acinetobacter baumannii]
MEERTDVVNIFGKNLARWIIIGLLVVALFNLFQSPSVRGTGTSMAYSDFLNDVNNGQV